ncbi:hypothetical protein N7492_003448 [Penicillium capsulatum]|uniref:non-specific serine/threonine protein kinase n=1 Tax=Penicillium capsulatum TaxID=69766 RepID=A0A9W9IJH7_9EURO|nr:hypothetical protein N7492_003448 [Penicillium capsulatum]KAJ6121969.1 hypothetical protein N7512_004434 [Penicillium capsulatum]
MTRLPKIFANSVHQFTALTSQQPFLSIFPRRREFALAPFGHFNPMMAAKDRIEYNWIRGVESLEEYRHGGYHPIMIGDMLYDRYRIADKLGFGGYSTVWLAQDTHSKQFVAVKVSIAESLPHEIKTVKALSLPPSLPMRPGRDLIPVLLDEFKVQGPNGEHFCYTVTPAQCNLREISFSRLFPLDVARALVYGLAQAVAYIHSQGYVHGDIHLSNILVKLPSSFDGLSIEQLYKTYGEPETVPVTRCDEKPLPPNASTKAVVPLFLGKSAEKFCLSDAHPLLSDFGEAFSPASEVRLGKDCHAPLAFRAPETIHLEPMPSEWWESWIGRSRFFDEHGRPTESHKENKWPSFEESFEIGVQKWRKEIRDEMMEDEKCAFLDLMRRMLQFRPEQRLTAEEVLLSEWMVKWALPDYERKQKA